MDETKPEIALVTRKALATFGIHNPICIPLTDSHVFVTAAIIEYMEAEDPRRRMNIPDSFTIVGLTEGKKLEKSLRVYGRFGAIQALVEIE